MIAIAFALRGTLTETHDLERDAFVALVRERCRALERSVPTHVVDDVARALFGGAADETVSPARMARTVTDLLDDVVADAVLVARFRQIADGVAARAVTPLPTVPATIERIASLGVPTAVLCNGWSRIAQREAACAGFTGPVLVSEDIGAQTPSPAAFAALVDALGVPAERIWYVGNEPRRDVDGAARAGLRAIWLDRDGTPYSADLEPPALTIRRLEDVLPPLCEEYTRSLLSLRHLMRTALEWRDGHYLPPTARW